MNPVDKTPRSDSEPRGVAASERAPKSGGSRFWQRANFVVAALLGAALAEATKLFRWDELTLAIVGGIAVAVWVPIALWLAFVREGGNS